MITLDELFQDLSYGELQMHKLGGYEPREDTSQPHPENYAKVISHINLGLKKLHSEFLLSVKEMYVDLSEEIETYVLTPAYAASNTDSAVAIEGRYIADTAEQPFLNDIIKIEEIYDEGGNLLPLNDFTDDESLYTPQYNSVQVPWPNNYNTIAVQYRAAHPKIEFTPLMDLTAVEMHVPLQLQMALYYFVASRVFASQNSDGQNLGNSFYNKFLGEIADVRRQGLYTHAETTNPKFDEGGWK